MVVADVEQDFPPLWIAFVVVLLAPFLIEMLEFIPLTCFFPNKLVCCETFRCEYSKVQASIYDGNPLALKRFRCSSLDGMHNEIINVSTGNLM